MKRFDAHRFYKSVAGLGLKGVDFIGIYRGEKLVLIEVKNYVDRFVSDGRDPSKEFMDAPTAYLSKVALKFRDSLKLVSIIQKYYQRQWWYRQCENYIFPKLSAQKLLLFESGFWYLAAHALTVANALELVLWLEVDHVVANDYQKFQKILREEASKYEIPPSAVHLQYQATANAVERKIVVV